MKIGATIEVLFVAMLSVLFCGCHGGGEAKPVDADPPPDASRPHLKTEAEIRAARDRRVDSGDVVLAETPTVAAERAPEAPQPEHTPPEPIQPSRDSIRSDILMVNDTALSANEVLYPMWRWIDDKRASEAPQVFQKDVREQVTNQIRRDIGTLLVYEKALAALDEQKKKMLDTAADHEVDAVVAHDFGGSRARFENELTRRGLTIDQFRESRKRQFLARSFTHDLFASQIEARRDELLAYYREHVPEFSTEESREFLLISISNVSQLPEGLSWPRASASERAVAKLAATRRARDAHEALRRRSFGDVAREYSTGIHAADGGSWGLIGKPLRAPYDEVSKLIFGYRSGQYSDPIQTDDGWFIVGCGKIERATQKSFSEVQDEVRIKLEDQRYAALASDYIYRLAERAAISDLSGFVDRTIERALAGSASARE